MDVKRDPKTGKLETVQGSSSLGDDADGEEAGNGHEGRSLSPVELLRHELLAALWFGPTQLPRGEGRYVSREWLLPPGYAHAELCVLTPNDRVLAISYGNVKLIIVSVASCTGAGVTERGFPCVFVFTSEREEIHKAIVVHILRVVEENAKRCGQSAPAPASNATAENESKDSRTEDALDRQLERENLAATATNSVRIPSFKPTEGPIPSDVIAYVPPLAFEEVVTLVRNAVRQLPTGQVRDITVPIIRGPMGCGKTTLAIKVVEEVSKMFPGKNIINCYVRLDDLLAEIPTLATAVNATSILASVLVHAFTLFGAHVQMPLSEVRARIVSDLKSEFVILHLDEFQHDLKVSEAIIAACKITMTTRDYLVCVMPILSGISSFGPSITAPSGLSAKESLLGQLPRLPLWESFIGSLNPITTKNFDNCVNLRCLFDDCGLYAHQVVCLAQEVLRYTLCHAGLTSGVLADDHANVIYREVMTRLQSVYGEHRSGVLFESDRNVGQARCLGDNLVAQVVLYVAAGKPVVPGDQVKIGGSKAITWQQCQDTGKISLEKVGDAFFAKCSMFALLVMNKFTYAIPLNANLELPFEADWQTLERVTLVSWMVHMQVLEANTRALLEDCRPGAYLRCSVEVGITVPERMSFKKAMLAPATNLVVGEFLLTFANEAGVDGIVLFDGFVEGEARKILVLSQTKKQGHSKTGEQAATTITGSNIRKILAKMKKVVEMLPEAVQEPFVVYDVFNDRFGAKRGLEKVEFDLGADEALIVTTSEEIDSVLGGLATRKREVPT
ncbi:hypothetical protein BASA81_007345 [Batrachochytrium salamandrivorans]|nr:hypothetical protein BASA81_007345 [Batrachochytrium salamandrivorans]